MKKTINTLAPPVQKTNFTST